MGAHDPRIDAYIEDAAEFARPILGHLRTVVHAACPEVEETMRWSFPHFDYKGRMMCSMAAFKEHCTLGFRNARLVVGENAPAEKAMGQFGRVRTLSDLPSARTLKGYVKKAMALEDAGVKPPRAPRRRKRPEAPVPDDLAVALGKRRRAREVFEGFSPSHRWEYIEWITEAKRPETRAKRVAQTVEWLTEGKPRNWKYLARK